MYKIGNHIWNVLSEFVHGHLFEMKLHLVRRQKLLKGDLL